MTRLICPFCGERELHEFQFRKTLPAEGVSPFAQVYLRVENPVLSTEHWQHVLGCRAWLVVQRNPSTGSVLGTRLLQGESA